MAWIIGIHCDGRQVDCAGARGPRQVRLDAPHGCEQPGVSQEVQQQLRQNEFSFFDEAMTFEDRLIQFVVNATTPASAVALLIRPYATLTATGITTRKH